ncbi:hypothetical protein M0R45_006205 [Rubus argutus]|uniref:Uncharacterized protein n=1 Tax=Rubus argutus TaxID=59490 RepID=A0AAW1YPW0_RUBAR
MKVEAESGLETEETLDQLLAAVCIDKFLTKKDIEKLANKLLEIGKLRDDQIECENEMGLILDIQHSHNSESDNLRNLIEALKEI